MMVQDVHGIMHEVYNKLELRESYETYRYVENWQVRTRCNPDKHCPFLINQVSRAPVDFGGVERGDIVTCVRCLAIECDHGISFDQAKVVSFRMDAEQVRLHYPRLAGTCRKGCGYTGIFYASHAHYVYGDW